MRRIEAVLIICGAIFFLPLIRVCLSTFGYRRTVRLLSVLSPEPPPGGKAITMRSLRLAKRFGSLRLPKRLLGSCLHKSIFLWWLLRFAGCQADIVTGVKKDSETGLFMLHAWVQHGNYPVNEPPAVVAEYCKLDLSSG